MAQSTLFETFNQAKEDFEDYIIRLKNYFIIAKIKEEQKAPYMISILGAEHFKTLKGLAAPEDVNSWDFEKIVNTMKDHFCKKNSQIYERYLFHKMSQSKFETINDFTLRLRKQCEKCNYTNFEENLLDRFVATLVNENIIKRLLIEEKLDFKKAERIAKMIEAAYNESANIKNNYNERNEVQIITNNKNQAEEQMINTNRNGRPTPACKHCGKNNHEHFKCWLKNNTCFICKKKGVEYRVCILTSLTRPWRRGSWTAWPRYQQRRKAVVSHASPCLRG